MSKSAVVVAVVLLLAISAIAYRCTIMPVERDVEGHRPPATPIDGDNTNADRPKRTAEGPLKTFLETDDLSVKIEHIPILTMVRSIVPNLLEIVESDRSLATRICACGVLANHRWLNKETRERIVNASSGFLDEIFAVESSPLRIALLREHLIGQKNLHPDPVEVIKTAMSRVSDLSERVTIFLSLVQNRRGGGQGCRSVYY